MQKKRTASLPIFNRGKRPRQALLTHPNNNVDAGSLEQQKQGGGHCSNNPQYHACVQTQQRHTQPRYSSYPKNQPTTNTAASHLPGRCNHSQSNKENLYTAGCFRPFRGNRNAEGGPPGPPRPTYSHTSNAAYNSSSTNSCRGPCLTPHTSISGSGTNGPLPTHHTSNIRSFSSAPSSGSSALGRAAEPTMYHSAKLEPTLSAYTPVQKLNHLPRVLTATAQGLEYWNKYKSHMPMMFEIFGTLSSAVVAGPLNSREFSVQTHDGTLRCLFWEMDTALPHLVRGKHLRVVGSWDESQRWVKCHCVREATQQEVQCTEGLVAICDATMRQTVAKLPEL